MMKMTPAESAPEGSNESTAVMHFNDSNTNVPPHSIASSSGDDDDCDEGIESVELEVPRMPDNEEEGERALVKTETKAVRVLRVVTLVVMVSAAITVSLLVYFFLKKDEEDSFSGSFYDLAHRLIDGAHANAALRVQTMDMLGLSLTSCAIATNQSWPYVTIPDFEARATAARSIVKSDYVGIHPYINEATRKSYEAYTARNTYWLSENFAYQADFKSVHNRTVGTRAPARALRDMSLDDAEYTARWLQEQEPDNTDDARSEVRNATFDGPDGIPLEIYRYGTEEEGYLFVFDDNPGPYYPMWQVSPTREFSAIDVNFNIADDYYSGAFSQAPETVRTTQTAIFGGVWNVDDTGYIDENDDYDFRTVPAASLFYPIFDQLTGDKEVVAVLDLDFEFGPLFSSLLPSNSNRIVCVVQNTCGQTFTYEVTGEMATYLGADDMHDPKFDDMVVSALLTDFDKTQTNIYNGPPINKDFCPWVVNVYPTQDMEDAHLTARPIYYMICVLGVFLFTCLVFLLYDFLVEFRQRKVSSVAKRSEKIVSSLFPKNVREQMYATNKKQEQEKRRKQRQVQESTKNPFSKQSDRVQDFLDSSSPDHNHSSTYADIANSPPIAELYPNCTVFFADIAGFTAWSSARSPTEVFTLLETLYGAFDKLAQKHKVFKIETIGDCYVAVTGLPVAQPNHALQMAKFSKDVHSQMKKMTQKLEWTLGPDTSNLAMRVGLHSGPVTAGVLRGEKARFQLFGDTVNTAARMESNGQREMIHVSQQTADLLSQHHGKGHWVHAREDKIHAKGKGELQTYFVEPKTGPGSVASVLVPQDSGSNLWDICHDEEVVEEALKGFEGTDEQKGEWTEANYRRINWLKDLFKEELNKIVNQQQSGGGTASWEHDNTHHVADDFIWDDEIIESLLSYSSRSSSQDRALSAEESRQLLEFVTQVAYSCQKTNYHCFEHACVILQSVDKMLKQFDSVVFLDAKLNPRAKFACLLAALIRNMDSPGVPDINPSSDATSVQHQSTSKLASTAQAMHLFREKQFKDLQAALCGAEGEFRCFWNLVQNLVLATDTSGGHLCAERDRRWEAAFGIATDHKKSKATPAAKTVTVLEHILLLAQECHSIQHWNNYVKWSDLLLQDYQQQHQSGGLTIEPERLWNRIQKDYFDAHVIPLTKKVEKAGVLGAMGEECAMYAHQNRQELASESTRLLLDLDAEPEPESCPRDFTRRLQSTAASAATESQRKKSSLSAAIPSPRAALSGRKDHGGQGITPDGSSPSAKMDLSLISV